MWPLLLNTSTTSTCSLVQVQSGQCRQAKTNGAPGCRLKRANKCGDSFSSVASNSLALVVKSLPYFCPLCPPRLAYGPSSGSPIGNLHNTHSFDFQAQEYLKMSSRHVHPGPAAGKTMWSSTFSSEILGARQLYCYISTARTLRNTSAKVSLLERRVCHTGGMLGPFLRVARISDQV